MSAKASSCVKHTLSPMVNRVACVRHNRCLVRAAQWSMTAKVGIKKAGIFLHKVRIDINSAHLFFSNSCHDKLLLARVWYVQNTNWYRIADKYIYIWRERERKRESNNTYTKKINICYTREIIRVIRLYINDKWIRAPIPVYVCSAKWAAHFM